MNSIHLPQPCLLPASETASYKPETMIIRFSMLPSQRDESRTDETISAAFREDPDDKRDA